MLKNGLKSRALKKSDSLLKELGFFYENGTMETNGGGLNMLKDNSRMCLSLSPYQGLYDAIIPQKHLLRRIKEKYRFQFCKSHAAQTVL